MASLISFVKEFQSSWFIQLRWLAAGSGLAAVLIIWVLFPAYIYPLPLILTLLGLMGLNVVYSWIETRLDMATPYFVQKQRKINNLLRAQMLGDLVILFLLLLFSGGLQNPLVFLFLLHIVIASILFSKKESWKYALTCLLFPVILFVLAWTGYNPTRLGFLHQEFSLTDEACRLTAFFIVAAGIWLVVSRIALELRGAELQVRESGDMLSKTKMDLLILESHRGRLLKNLAKELTLPIQTILDHLAAVEKNAKGGDFLKVQTALHEFRNEMEGLRSISSDLEWLSEPHWRDREYHREKVDLTALAAREVSRNALSAKEKNLRLKLTGPSKVFLNADRRSLQQILDQLLSNAIKYTPYGRGDILVEVGREVPFAYFSVSDHGVGIPENEKSNLFQEFYRSSNAESSKTSGSGLGLYIVKEIVDWHRGTIKVDSVLGQGTTVKVWVPMEDGR
jgi:signal transduction histidine kinase